MRYTITEGVNAGKNVNIPDEFIEKNMANLGLTKEEVIEMFLDDEGYKENEVVAELTEKAKTAGTGAVATGEKAKRKPPVRQPDELKRELVANLFDFLSELEGAENVNVTNVERMIAFTVGDESFEVTLTKKRKPKA